MTEVEEGNNSIIDKPEKMLYKEFKFSQKTDQSKELSTKNMPIGCTQTKYAARILFYFSKLIITYPFIYLKYLTL